MAKEKRVTLVKLESLEIEVHNLRATNSELQAELRRSQMARNKDLDNLQEQVDATERDQRLMLLCIEALGRGLASAGKRT